MDSILYFCLSTWAQRTAQITNSQNKIENGLILYELVRGEVYATDTTTFTPGSNMEHFTRHRIGYVLKLTWFMFMCGP